MFFGVYLAACALLVVAGAAKAIRPTDTARALGQAVSAIPLIRMALLVRVAAAVECALGVAGIVLPWPPIAAAVALSYLAFAGFVFAARLRGGPLATCGCFGTPDTPPTVVHVVINVGLAVSAVVVAAAGRSGSLLTALSGQPWHGIPLVAASGVCAWLIVLALSPLARLGAARRLITATGEGVS
ncbi:MAG TPA: MauE/DoxX family redox-associated membrane protein [Acidimicrobiales bacterium]|jgi:hypothetical protein|nr:MauE/DoxX family redox-associated membrane protein [Acidimicrobiales bacterium]